MREGAPQAQRAISLLFKMSAQLCLKLLLIQFSIYMFIVIISVLLLLGHLIVIIIPILVRICVHGSHLHGSHLVAHDLRPSELGLGPKSHGVHLWLLLLLLQHLCLHLYPTHHVVLHTSQP